MNKAIKEYLDEAGYKEVKLLKWTEREFPCGIELLNSLSCNYYMFDTNDRKIVYGMFNVWIDNEWQSETEYIYIIKGAKLFRKDSE